MRKGLILILVVLGTVMFVAGNSSLCLAKVSVEILQDIYVLPVAELATTKTHPEVIRIENDFVEMTLIPNRGRVLSSYVLKGKEPVSVIYQNLVPGPMVLPGGLHVVEFGGYYLSLPWNDRDRQPFDLSFALTREEESLVEVFLSGKDMFKKTLTECWVRVRDDSPVVEVEVKITNLSKREARSFPFKDFVVLDVRRNCYLSLPVKSVKLVASRGDWAGQPGQVLGWPAMFASWDNMKDYLHFETENSPLLPCVAAMYPDERVAFVKWWEPAEFFPALSAWSWGQSWAVEPGAGAYIVVSGLRDNFHLEPQEQVSFKVYFVAFEGVSQDVSCQELFDQARSLLR